MSTVAIVVSAIGAVLVAVAKIITVIATANRKLAV